MTISARLFSTKTRTWLLVAALTALLVGVGALVGGMFLYTFVALAVVANVLGNWFSDRIALRASRAQRVEPGTIPEVEAMVQDLADERSVAHSSSPLNRWREPAPEALLQRPVRKGVTRTETPHRSAPRDSGGFVSTGTLMPATRPFGWWRRCRSARGARSSTQRRQPVLAKGELR
jgi:hypothetical protein